MSSVWTLTGKGKEIRGRRYVQCVDIDRVGEGNKGKEICPVCGH